jgi:four helix bundle protein
MPTEARTVDSYRDLIAWQKAMELVCAVYAETAKLPGDERFGLIAQMRRCAVSIASNIAEGWGRRTASDYIRFLQMSCGSVHELSTQVEICHRLDFEGAWLTLDEKCQDLGRIINGLINSIQCRARPTPNTQTPNS